MGRANFSDRERGREIYRVREMGVMVPEKKEAMKVMQMSHQLLVESKLVIEVSGLFFFFLE